MKNSQFLLLAACVAVTVQGCDSGRDNTVDVPPEKKLRLAFVCNNSGDYWDLLRLGCDYGTRVLGNVDLEFRETPERTVAAQQATISNLVAGGVDGIAISPIDADSQTDFLNSIATGTLLVCVDGDAENSKRLCYIGTDNVSAGIEAAELLKAALPEGGKVALFVGYLNAQNAKDRIQGIKTGLSGSNIEIIETLVDDSKSALAVTNALDTLARYPDLAGMVGLYGYNGPAILTAVRSAGKTGQVKIVCFDEQSETLAGIVSGDIYGTIAQRPLKIGFETIRAMAEYLRGDKSRLEGGKIYTTTRPITKSNVADFQAELRMQLEASSKLSVDQ